MNEVELGAKAFLLLIGIGAISGVASMWAFRRWSNTVKLRAAINRIVAHLFELRLFADEPILVMRAQRDLLAANGALLRQVTGPSLLLVLPFAILLFGMDAFFGRAPLEPGRPAIVTLQSSRSHLLPARLTAPAGIEVETPPVRIPTDSQISWRVRPVRAVSGELQILYGGRAIKKHISSKPGLQWLFESNSISIRYPAATVFHLNWLVWFSLASFTGAITSLLAVHRR